MPWKIHGEAQAIPVAGAAQSLQLFNDAVAVLVLPVPNLIQESFTAQVEAGQTLFTELFFNLDLGSDACVVVAGHPQCFKALHSLVTNQNILNGFVECVTQMQLTGNVGRRHHNGKGGLFGIGLCVEVATLDPHIVDLLFYLLRFINFRQFFHLFHSFLSKK